MNTYDRDRLAALARTLGVSPRAALVAAARLARDTDRANPARRRSVVREAREELAATRGSAALLLATPIADFALDDTDRALATQRHADDAKGA